MRRKHHRYATEKECCDQCRDTAESLDWHAFELSAVAHDARRHGVSKEILDMLKDAAGKMDEACGIVNAVLTDIGRFKTKLELEGAEVDDDDIDVEEYEDAEEGF